MDSGGKAEKSRGWILLADLGVAAARFREGDFFGRAGLAAFEGLAEGLERRAGFLAGLSAGFVFPVGMRRTSVQIYQRSRPVARRLKNDPRQSRILFSIFCRRQNRIGPDCSGPIG